MSIEISFLADGAIEPLPFVIVRPGGSTNVYNRLPHDAHQILIECFNDDSGGEVSVEQMVEPSSYAELGNPVFERQPEALIPQNGTIEYLNVMRGGALGRIIVVHTVSR